MMVRSWLYDVDVVVWWCSHQFMLYALGVDESIVVIELWWICNFYENGLIMKKFDFDDVKWVKEVFRMN